MTPISDTLQKIESAVNTGTCPNCGNTLVFDFNFTHGWEYTCPHCHWSCGGSV